VPQPHAGQLVPQAMLGAFVGIVPVVIGMLFYPALRNIGGSGMNFVPPSRWACWRFCSSIR
jgi:hypothetical protein